MFFSRSTGTKEMHKLQEEIDEFIKFKDRNAGKNSFGCGVKTSKRYEVLRARMEEAYIESIKEKVWTSVSLYMRKAFCKKKIKL